MLDRVKLNEVIKNFSEKISIYKELKAQTLKVKSKPTIRYEEMQTAFTLYDPSEVVTVMQSLYCDRVQIDKTISEYDLVSILESVYHNYQISEYAKIVDVKIQSFQRPGTNPDYLRELENGNYELRFYATGFKK